MTPIYLDNNATARIAPEVLAAMLPFLDAAYGNPSSSHALGQAARNAVENARSQVASFINARPREIVFTASGTEADNLAIRGLLAASPAKRRIITTRVEHDAVLNLCKQLERENYRVTWLDVDTRGRLDPDAFAAALTDDTALASIMYANNETGVIFPVEQLARTAAARGVPLHVDAVQIAGKHPLNMADSAISLLTLSAHKLHGPKGAGALYIRRGIHLRPQLYGGHQERDLRAGTENVAALVGFGAAADLARTTPAEVHTRIAALRDRLECGLLEKVPFAHVNGDPESRTGNTTNLGFETLEAEAIILTLSGHNICASAGSACSSGSLEPSHVLTAMGIPAPIAHGGVRFSLSRYTTPSEIEEAIQRIPPLLHRLRGLLPSMPQ